MPEVRREDPLSFRFAASAPQILSQAPVRCLGHKFQMGRQSSSPKMGIYSDLTIPRDFQGSHCTCARSWLGATTPSHEGRCNPLLLPWLYGVYHVSSASLLVGTRETEVMTYLVRGALFRSQEGCRERTMLLSCSSVKPSSDLLSNEGNLRLD